MSDYELDYSEATYRCPECKEAEGFWETIDLSGWRSINVSVTETGDPAVEAVSLTPGDWGYDESSIFPTGAGGCAMCSWEGRIPGDLEFHAPKRVGWDGKPIRKPMAGQLELA